ncbi:hypothetical protein SDJN02_25218, partial [Cucurbita argyrosperma subsp. argyrosperma]
MRDCLFGQRIWDFVITELLYISPKQHKSLLRTLSMNISNADAHQRHSRHYITEVNMEKFADCCGCCNNIRHRSLQAASEFFFVNLPGLLGFFSACHSPSSPSLLDLSVLLFGSLGSWHTICSSSISFSRFITVLFLVLKAFAKSSKNSPFSSLSVLSCICPCCLCVTVAVEFALALINVPILVMKWFTSKIPC